MTKTTEELKREMYGELAELKDRLNNKSSTIDIFRGVIRFENSMEAYFESLRKEHISLSQDRDTLRNKLQAFEFANRSAAELLSEALREPSGLRKTSQAIPQQESEDLVSCAACRPSDELNYPSNVVPIFKLIRENTEYTLTPEQFEAFELMLKSKPASENKALQELLSRKPGWSDGDQS